MIIETDYTPKLEKLLNSSDEANHHIAFQIMSEIGAPSDLHPIMTNQVSKIFLCIQYGFENIVSERIVYMPDEFLQETIRQILGLTYDIKITYQNLWQLETLTLQEVPPKNHFTFGLEDDATNLEGLQFATQLKKLTILNHEMNENELEVLQYLGNIEYLYLQGISRGVFRMKAIDDWSPIGHLLQLKELHLIENQLSDVSFLPKHLPHLQLLNLQKNDLVDLKHLVNNPAIEHCIIDVRKNPLNMGLVAKQITRLNARNVEVVV